MIHRNAGFPCELSADQYRLVETAAPQARRMKRHRNNDRAMGTFFDKFLQMVGNQFRQSQSSAIFQAHCNQRTAVIITHHGPDAVVNGRLRKAFCAAAFVGVIKGERKATGNAPGLGEKIQLSPARQAESIVCIDGGTADWASWRQRIIDQ